MTSGISKVEPLAGIYFLTALYKSYQKDHQFQDCPDKQQIFPFLAVWVLYTSVNDIYSCSLSQSNYKDVFEVKLKSEAFSHIVSLGFTDSLHYFAKLTANYFIKE